MKYRRLELSGDKQTPRQTPPSKLCATHDPSWSTRMDADQQPHLRHSVAILWRGDAAARRDATPQNSRFVRVFEALAASGIEARPAVYDESFADAVRDQLLAVDGVLVWVDPIHQGNPSRCQGESEMSFRHSIHHFHQQPSFKPHPFLNLVIAAQFRSRKATIYRGTKLI